MLWIDVVTFLPYNLRSFYIRLYKIWVSGQGLWSRTLSMVSSKAHLDTDLVKLGRDFFETKSWIGQK